MFTRNVNILLCGLLTFFVVVSSQAQGSMRGRLFDLDSNKGVSDGYVSVFCGDSLVQFLTSDENGFFTSDSLKEGKYRMKINVCGYAPLDTLYENNVADQVFYCFLTKDQTAYQLGEAVVDGHREMRVVGMPDGHRFYLSSRAKQERNPFFALMEIPLLEVQPENAAVKMRNGKALRILIDGKKVNTGIAPISPSEIESVDIIEMVDAVEMMDGVGAVLNIKLKRKEHPYVWTEVAARHDVPIYQGSDVYYFEVGNPKVSLYGRTYYENKHHEDRYTDVVRSNSTYEQTVHSHTRTNGNAGLGELQFKWTPSKRDYFAANVLFKGSGKNTYGDGEGYFDSDNYASGSFGRIRNKIVTTNAYFMRDYGKGRNYEVNFTYNATHNTDYDRMSETYGTVNQMRIMDYDNRHQGIYLTAEYNQPLWEKYKLRVSGGFRMELDDIKHLEPAEPIFRCRQSKNYVSAKFSGPLNQWLSFNLSAACQPIWLKAGGVDNFYVRPWGVGGLVANLKQQHYLMLSYSFSNSLPSLSCLNPRNVSTDSLIVMSGNPYLRPAENHSVSLSYQTYQDHLSVVSECSYTYVANAVDSYGFTDDKGVYTSTYRNFSKYSDFSFYNNFSYNYKSFNAGAAVGWGMSMYEGQSARHHAVFILNAGYRLLRKWAFYAEWECRTKSYGINSYSKYDRPSTAKLQCTYFFTPDFYISAFFQHLTGSPRTVSVMDDGTYHTETTSWNSDEGYLTSILLRYTFRKNPKRKIKLSKTFENYEKGVTIRREK